MKFSLPIISEFLLSSWENLFYSGPTCTSFHANVSASSNNWNISNLPAIDLVPISGTYSIFFKYCQPLIPSSDVEPDAIIIAHPGATYTHHYWDIQYEPETYSFVRRAVSEGYPILLFDRLGTGESDRPDPINVIQTQMEIEIAKEISERLRQGSLIPDGRAYKRLIHVAHSYGSMILHGVAAAHPTVIDIIVHTGYTSTMLDAVNLQSVAQFTPAPQVDPERWSTLDPNFQSTLNISTRAAIFYKGEYDRLALAWDELRKDTLTIGEFVTRFYGSGQAKDYDGPVAFIIGEYDLIFCPPEDPTLRTGECGGVGGVESILAREARSYPKASTFHYSTILGIGHCINFHPAAPKLYTEIFAFLKEQGF